MLGKIIWAITIIWFSIIALSWFFMSLEKRKKKKREREESRTEQKNIEIDKEVTELFAKWGITGVPIRRRRPKK